MMVATRPRLRQAAVLAPRARHDRHELVAVDGPALLVDDQHPVGVAVERDADVGAKLTHAPDQRLRAQSSRRRG